MGRRGWVYVLTNPAMPGLVKIGCTGRMPGDRARELSDKTSVPTPFVVAWCCPVSDWQAVERLTHSRLSACRPNRNREFFACSARSARRAVKAAASAYMRPWWLRLGIGPWSSRPAPGGRRRLEHGDPVPVLAVYGLIVVVGLIGWLKPAVPSWVPPDASKAVLFIERHAP